MAVKLTTYMIKAMFSLNLNAVIKELQTDTLYKLVKHKDDYSLLKIWESRKDFQQGASFSVFPPVIQPLSLTHLVLIHRPKNGEKIFILSLG